MNLLKDRNERKTTYAVFLSVLIGLCAIPWISGAQGLKGDTTIILENPVEVTIQVSQENGVVIASTKFENTGKASSLVKRGFNGFGPRTVKYGGSADSLFDPEFSLICDGKPLRYIGRITMWAPLKRSGFDLIAPGEVIATRHIRLDEVYRFSQAGQVCTITHFHLEFDPVTEQILRVRSVPTSFTYHGKTAADVH
jgi:hypothetical protein